MEKTNKKIIWAFLLEDLKRYFETTPKEILDKEWEEKAYLDEIGPDVMDYFNHVKKYYESENTKEKEEELL